MILYSKFSNDRHPALNICTDIMIPDGSETKCIRKRAANGEARAHIENMAKAQTIMEDLFADSPFKINKGEYKADGLYLEFLEGYTLEEEIDALLDTPEKAADLIVEYCQAIRRLADCTFVMTEAFRSVFGAYDFPSDEPCLSAADIDMIFSNVIVNDGWNLIDYEWSFLFPVPVDYVVWRVLKEYLGLTAKRRTLDGEAIGRRVGMTWDRNIRYLAMEENFQKYVRGENTSLQELYTLQSPGYIKAQPPMFEGVTAPFKDEYASLKQAFDELTTAYRTLSDDYSAMQDRFLRARGAAIEKGELAAAISSNASAKAFRKILVKAGKSDPFAQLRPNLSASDCEIRYSVDSVSYRDGCAVIRGWAYDLDAQTSVPLLLRDRSAVIPMTVRRFVRKDVNKVLGLPDEVEAGFVLRVDLGLVKHHTLMLEFENERGYLSHELQILLTDEERQAWNKANAHPIPASDNIGYDDWFHDHRVKEAELEAQRQVKFAYEPKISICIPLFNTPEVFLRELMDSLLGQSYQNFEVCLADGSTSDETGRIIRESYSDPRVVYERLKENKGISGNTNQSMAMASGDFIMLCDHDDTVERDALYEIVKRLNEEPETDIVYTDEDKLMVTDGTYYSPNLKPDFSPDLLRSNNYITHIFCVRKSIVDEIGGEDSAYDGAQDYDFILRCVEKARIIGHVAKILYHWRAHEASTAGNPESKMYAYDAGRRAIQAHYDRVGIKADVAQAEDIGSYRTVYRIQGEPKISVIIPNKDQKETLRRCLTSIFEHSTYRNYEVVIAENNSETEEIFDYYKELQTTHKNVKIVTWKDAFNYSAINNFAAKEASGDYLIFLNNDTEVITETWMEEMLGYCQRGDVGMCGARLYYPKPHECLQHCGVVVGIGGVAGHICHMTERGNGGYFGRVTKSQDVSAVTAACMMMPRHIFEEVGGFEESFAVAYNDIDLCLKVRDKGYLIVYNAWCELYHYESLSRGSDEAAVDKAKHDRQIAEARRLRERWPVIFKNGDPYFNPNLDYDAADFVMAGTIPPDTSGLKSFRKELE